MKVAIKQDGLDALIEIRVAQADYQKICQKKLKEETEKVSLKGFRRGKAPFAYLNKRFGASIRSQEVSRLVAGCLSETIKKEGFSLIGEPIFLPKVLGIPNWETEEDYAFAYRVGILETVPLHLLSKAVKIKRYNIALSSHTLDEQVENLRLRYGTIEAGKQVGVDDILRGKAIQQRRGGIALEEEIIFRYSSLTAPFKRSFLGQKVGYVSSVVVATMFAQGSGMDYLSKKLLKKGFGVEETMFFHLTGIDNPKKVPLDTSLYEQVFAGRGIKTKTAFLSLLEEEMKKSYAQQSAEYLAYSAYRQAMVVISFALPETYVRERLAMQEAQDEQPLSEEGRATQAAKYREGLRWAAIKHTVADKAHIKVDKEEVVRRVGMRVAQHMGGVPTQQEDFNKMVQQVLQAEDGKYVNEVYEDLRNEKVMAWIADRLTVEEQTISVEDFEKERIAQRDAA